MGDLALRLSGISKRYARRQVLDDVGLSIDRGSFSGLLGPSGSGKTTLLRIAAGLEDPDAGTVTLDGQVVWGPASSIPPERRGVGMVFQDLALWPHMTARQHLEFVTGGRTSERRRNVEEWLERVRLLDRAEARPGELSGGERQRLAIARALAPAPRLLLLDEPFKSLDEPLATVLAREVRELVRRAGATALLVSHARAEALALCERVAFLHGGRVLLEGSPGSMLEDTAPEAVRSFYRGLTAPIVGREVSK
ncbi:MAG: ATP-binding cassette domain-containing protein [Candidatus Wallbacteria bacterium]|nr:ATP-binding cassette domain-containing protein [Candidatus Wallbacteria bacterium]